MKRRTIAGSEAADPPEIDEKRAKIGEEAAIPELGEDLVIEILKRADDRTLAASACVSRRWRSLADDERLWEAVCTRHWANIGCGNQQLRSVVLALGGFRRLHSLYLLPLLRSPSAAGRPRPSLLLPVLSPSRRGLPARWGKDEVQLSLSLLSIGYFEKMNLNYPRPGGGSSGGAAGGGG